MGTRSLTRSIDMVRLRYVMGSLAIICVVGCAYSIQVAICRGSAEQAKLYQKWMEGNHLIEEGRAREFEKLFRPPLNGTFPEREDIGAIVVELETTREPGPKPVFVVSPEYYDRIYDQLKNHKV